MHALPILISLPLAASLAPLLLGALRHRGQLRRNYRGRSLPFPLGALILLSGVVTLATLALIDAVQGVSLLPGSVATAAAFVVGAGALGLVDDAFGGQAPKGFRGHCAALLCGRISTGVVKAVGVTALALLASAPSHRSAEHWLLAAAVLTLATHVFNLLDLRPGRSVKALLVLGVALIVGTSNARPLLSLGAFLGPALVAGLYDLREWAMLGDTGASVLGALAGLWLTATLPLSGQAIALLALALTAIYGELRSISMLVDRSPWLRQLDSLGRPS